MFQRMDEKVLLPQTPHSRTTALNTPIPFGRGRLIMSEPSLCSMYLPKITMSTCVCLSRLQSTCNMWPSICRLGLQSSALNFFCDTWEQHRHMWHGHSNGLVMCFIHGAQGCPGFISLSLVPPCEACWSSTEWGWGYWDNLETTLTGERKFMDLGTLVIVDNNCLWHTSCLKIHLSNPTLQS